MKTLIAGGSGFVGTPLVERLLRRGEVVVLSRDPRRVTRGRGVAWDGKSVGAWADELRDTDIVVNLAGANIGEHRWSAERKRLLVSSRIDSTSALSAALHQALPRARVFASASATGIYGDRGDELLDEKASAGSGFLADLALRWESAAQSAADVARVVIVRFGIILAPDGGALQKMLLPFRLFAGGELGSGRQWMPWIHRDDVLAAIEHVIVSQNSSGIYNVVAPEPVTNREFTRVLSAILRRPAIARAPRFALRLALGEMAEPLLLASQRAIPRRLQEEGFRFAHPQLEEALRSSL